MVFSRALFYDARRVRAVQKRGRNVMSAASVDARDADVEMTMHEAYALLCCQRLLSVITSASAAALCERVRVDYAAMIAR